MFMGVYITSRVPYIVYGVLLCILYGVLERLGYIHTAWTSVAVLLELGNAKAFEAWNSNEQFHVFFVYM